MSDAANDFSPSPLTWNVYVSNYTTGKIEPHNVFSHYGFLADCRKNRAVFGENREEFEKRLQRDLMYYYWCKCEWEVIISHWPPCERLPDRKIDVYSQIKMNWDHFVEYVWSHRAEL